MNANDALITGTPEQRILAALRQTQGSLSIAMLFHRAGLAWEEGYVPLGELLRAGVVGASKGASRMSRGERVHGAWLYWLRRGAT